MTRLIDADALKEKFKDREGDDFTVFHFYDVIDSAPTITSEITNEDIQNAIKQGYNDGFEMAKAKYERPQGDLISREALKEEIRKQIVTPKSKLDVFTIKEVFKTIDNATTVELTEEQAIDKLHETGWLIRHDKEMTERPQGEWIPVSERLPDNETEVLIQYGQSIMVGYHMWDFTVYPSEFADGNETGWYDCKDNFICGSDEVYAWQPLPEPYKAGGKEE